MDWQPIESAPTWQPQEGENISLGLPKVLLGWVGIPYVYSGFWRPDRCGGGQWEVCGDNPFMKPPTHWMPLPETPE